MNVWIYLYRGIAEPIAPGVEEEIVYAVANTKEQALTKVTQCIPGNYRVKEMEVIAELYDFGTGVYTPEIMQ